MLELTILMPCLNESATVAGCVSRALSFLDENKIEGEVLVVDNGSTDNSTALASHAGAKVVFEPRQGYGRALITGTNEAQGRYIIMGDDDGSYDMENLMPILQKLRGGCQLVVGDRFAGGIAPGAMPFLHRYVGNPILSAIGRFVCKSDVRDFHCGLRGYDRQAIKDLDLCATGFEYASEMIIKAERANLFVDQVPVTLSPDGRRGGHSHIRTFHDGMRHLKLMLGMGL